MTIELLEQGGAHWAKSRTRLHHRSVAPPPRPTKDVDVVVEIATRAAYEAFEDCLRGAGLREEGTVIRRWVHRESGLVLDAMPTQGSLLGFENRWQREAFPHSVEVELPWGARMRAVAPPFLLATRVEACLGRGADDLLGSRDFADIVALVDDRRELPGEVRAAPVELRTYLADHPGPLLANELVLDRVRARLLPMPPPKLGPRR